MSNFRFTPRIIVFLLATSILVAGIEATNQLTHPNTFTSKATIGATSKVQQEKNALFNSALKDVRPVLSAQVRETTSHQPKLVDISFYLNRGDIDLYASAREAELAASLAESYARKTAALISEWDLNRRYQQIGSLGMKVSEFQELERVAQDKLAGDRESQRAFREEQAAKDKVAAMQSQMISFQTERDSLKAALEVESASTKLVEADPQLLSIDLELGKQQKELERLSASLKPAHPEMIFIREVVADLQEKSERRRELLIKDLESDYEVIQRKIIELQTEIDLEQSKLVELSDKVVVYAQSVEKINSLRSSKRDLQKELDAQNLAAVQALPLAVVTVPAFIPQSADIAISWASVFQAALFGLCLGILFLLAKAILVKYWAVIEELDFYPWDDQVEDFSIREQNSFKPAVSSRPTIEAEGLGLRRVRPSGLHSEIEVQIQRLSRNSSAKVFGGQKRVGKTTLKENVHLFPYFDKQSGGFWSNHENVPTDVYRNLAKSLVSQTVSVGTKSRNVLVTSAVRGEGKSNVSNNLAKTLAKANYSTLIIDCNLKTNSSSTILPGLVNYLRGEIEPEQTIRKTDIDKLFRISSGQLSSDSMELICSQRMWELSQLVSTAFDFVIYDGPAVLDNNESLILSKISDATVMVVDSENTDKSASRDALEKLKRADDLSNERPRA